MNDDFDGRIDNDLRRAGEQWRARRPAPTSVDRSLFTGAPERRRSWVPALASVVGVLAILIVGVIVVVSLPPADPNVAAGSPSPTAPAANGPVEVLVSGRGEFLNCRGGESDCATFFSVDAEEWEMVYVEDPFPRFALPGDQILHLEPGLHHLEAHIDEMSNGQPDASAEGEVIGRCEREVSVEPVMARLTVEVTFNGPTSCEIAAYPLNPVAPIADHPPLPSVAPAATFTAEGISWDRYGADSLPHGIEAFDWIETSGSRIFATLHECGSGREPCTYMLLSSLDGRSWTVDAQISRGIHLGSQIRFFPDDEVGFVAAAGFLYDGPRAGLWHSRDGTTWEWVGNQASFDVPECESIESFDVFDVYRAGTQLVAQGRVYCGPKVYQRTWSSTDGREWEGIDYVPAVSVVEKDGAFVGISGTLRENALARSDDGLEWQIALETEMQVTLAPIASGFVAVGSRESQNPVALTSVDGRAWTEHPDAMDALSFGLLGSDGTRAAFVDESGPGAVRISSPDGQIWTSYPVPAQLDLVAILGNNLVLVSFSGPSYWVAQLADPPGE